jgi:hypothetical protein
VDRLLTPADSVFTQIADAMAGADFVLVDDEIFEAQYLRVPDECTVPEDVVIEATRGDSEILLTRAEIDGARHLGAGVFRLANGARLRFVVSATLH